MQDDLTPERRQQIAEAFLRSEVRQYLEENNPSSVPKAVIGFRDSLPRRGSTFTMEQSLTVAAIATSEAQNYFASNPNYRSPSPTQNPSS